MGLFNFLYFKTKCPRCNNINYMEAEMKIGKLNLDKYEIGDTIIWGSPTSDKVGNLNGKGYVECRSCHKDFWVNITVTNNVIVDVKVIDEKGYIE